MHSKPFQSCALQGQPSNKPKQKSSTAKAVRFEVNLDESDEGEREDDLNGSESSGSEVEEEGEPDEFFDVLDILDGRADPLSDDEPPAPSRENETLHASSDEVEADEDEDGDDQVMVTDPESEDQLASSDDEMDTHALQNLGQLISNLDSSSKRKASGGEGTAVAEDNAPRKKRKLKERNEAGAENEFAASGELGSDLFGIPLCAYMYAL